jgi:regulator of protease activity HflC (stomatin/prohibitin superfamily)
MVLTAQGSRESEITRAEGEKRAKILRAEGEAEARIKVARAEAEAITRITDSIAPSNGDPGNYLIALRYIETLKEMVSGKDNKVIYLPYEATGILSSIGGIKDMLEGARKGPA